MLQSQSFITRMRESLSVITETEQYKQYTTRYQNLIKVIMMMMLTKMMLMFLMMIIMIMNLIKEDSIEDIENQSQEIFNYFLNTFDVITMLRQSVIVLRMNMNDVIADELENIDKVGQYTETE